MDCYDFNDILDILEEQHIIKHSDRDILLDVLKYIYVFGIKKGIKQEKLEFKNLLKTHLSIWNDKTI